ncbi:amiloride-sensitive sodium channel subunit gamma-like [Brachionus plicatilis]|uniref:Amiloride-sensitive sodium channel subunit gamma-like n=1 Tax=Brachionus plicatilis TaxID=10195 RepID=A0A3M7S7W9_BRAPC|nr:amiloride-sensitive sodium channel subunit gamma-like [Brachionus plicatilis]
MTKKNELKKVLKAWATSTTAHGFPNIINNEIKLLKFIWLFFLIGSSSYCSYCLFRSFADYFSYKVNIQYTSVRYPSIEFPTVSICNLHRFKIDSNLSDFMFYLQHTKLEYVDNYLKKLLNKTPNITFIDGLTLDRYLNMLVSDYHYRNMSSDDKEKYSFKYEDLLINCRFNEKPCSKQDFEYFYSSLYGSCFKFNSKKYMNGSQRKVSTISRSGKNNGLMLELFTGNSSEYSFRRSNGIRLFVHNNSVPTIPLNDGIYLSPGFETNVIVDQINSNRLPQPFSNCIKEESPSVKNVYFYKNTISLNGKYEQKYCLVLCYQKFLIDQCGCFDSNFPSFEWSFPCQSEKITCIERKVEEFYNSKSEIECFENCPVECNVIDYDLKISFADYPTDFYSQILKAYDEIKCEKKFFSNEQIKKTTLAVNVFYDDISVTEITELRMKTAEQLIADVGGIMGL